MFNNQFIFIEEFAKAKLSERGESYTQIRAAECLGFTIGKYQAWSKGQYPKVEDLKTLVTHFSFNIHWLLFGKGEVFNNDKVVQKKEPFSCENEQNLLIGGLLQHIFDFLDLDAKTILKKTKIKKERLEELLSSSDYPTFQELEVLYTKLGINTRFLFDANEHHMHMPTDHLLRVFYALGWQGKIPTSLNIENIFSVDKEEAKEYLNKWKEAQKKGTYMFLPPKWLQNLESKYGFSAFYITHDAPPIMKKREEIDDKKNILKILALQDELIETQRQLAKYEKVHMIHTENCHENDEKSA